MICYSTYSRNRRFGLLMGAAGGVGCLRRHQGPAPLLQLDGLLQLLPLQKLQNRLPALGQTGVDHDRTGLIQSVHRDPDIAQNDAPCIIFDLNQFRLYFRVSCPDKRFFGFAHVSLLISLKSTKI